MGEFGFLFVLFIVFVIWVVGRVRDLTAKTDRLDSRLDRLDDRLDEELKRLQAELEYKPTPAAPVVPLKPEEPIAPVVPKLMIPVSQQPSAPLPAPPKIFVPPVISRPPPPPPPVNKVSLPSVSPLPSINWEQFMGVKLFAWIGGLALFLGVAFFVKYSFENNLISPELRVALGFITGIGLLVGGLVVARKTYEVLGQTLCATGVLVLYAVTFSTHAYYHFLNVLPAFAVMVLVTITAFLLAVRMNAQVVAVLGLLGGFLTPILLSTGKDNPLGLFGYLGLLDAGLIAVVWHKRWNYLMMLAAVGTALMQIAWVVKFFAGEKAYVAMGIFLGMEALFLVGFMLAQERDETDPWITASAFLLALSPLVFTLHLLSFPTLAGQPAIVFTFVLVADLGLLLLASLRAPLFPSHMAAGGAVFLILTVWTVQSLTDPLLNWALGFYLVFAILHSVYPLVFQRLHPQLKTAWWGHLFPVLALLLVMVPIFRLPEVSLLVWGVVLLLDLVIFGIALATASLAAIVGALVLTLAACALWILKIPATVMTDVPELLVVIGGFALLFFGLGIFATRKVTASGTTSSSPRPNFLDLPQIPVDIRAQIPALSAILPFMLLVMVVLRLPLHDPSSVFGLAMLLVVLLLGVTRATLAEWLSAVALVCSVNLEYVWHQERFQTEFAVVPLVWYLGFYLVFTIFPFLFHKTFSNRIVPWAVAALAGPVHFRLFYHVLKLAFPNPYMGVLPAVLAIPPFLGLIYLLRTVPADNARRNAQLAWFGGSTLFFITLIIPVQFDREWITVGWALEGAALLWLFHRVPHPGLRIVGVALLGTAFARLALNPAVLAYHPRSTTPLWNWYLYTYGIVTVCLLAGGKLLAPPRDRVLGCKAPPLLYGLGTVLAFLLLNIEIADYFSSGSTLTFEFSGNFARDMTYSIAWALFALGLLAVGIGEKLSAVRYASLGLLSVTLLKLFLHDLKTLGQLYRIGAFMGVAVILLLASFFYQRFLSGADKKEP